MNHVDRQQLTQRLSMISVDLAADLRTQLLDDPPTRRRAERLHDAERVGDAFELWTDLLSRRAAVRWILRSVYLDLTRFSRRMSDQSHTRSWMSDQLTISTPDCVRLSSPPYTRRGRFFAGTA